FVWKQNYILVDEYFFFCCTWIVNSALKYHQEQRFIMSCGDQIAEFSPEQFVETAVGVIKHHLDELPQDCRTISDNAINALIDEWKTKTQAL
ncbi:hypothetical protein NBD76_19355, partial [Salmonella sp. C3284]